MSQPSPTSTPEGSVPAGSLREAIEIKRVRGEVFSMRDAVAIVVPLCTHLNLAHKQEGLARFFVYPSILVHGKAGTELDFDRAKALPTHDRDRAVIAPECRKGELGDDRASVFAVGAILYELVTGESIGPGMRRPSEINPKLPPSIEVVLGKALVADPKHRPHDLAALAQALHHLAPAGSMPPPAADESHLDHEDGFDVDVSLSMLPPAPVGRPVQAVVSAVDAAPPSSRVRPAAAPLPDLSNADPTVRLAATKARLEADPRPRYVVVKLGMDHGPFSAVELLQQIASHSFTSEHLLRDTLSGEEKKLEEWPDFTLFAHQAHLNREIKQERKALEKVVTAERHRAQWKVLLGVTLLGLVIAGGAGYWLNERNRSLNEQKLRAEEASNVDAEGALSGKTEGKAPGGGPMPGGGGGGKYPVVAGGGSCESAKRKYVEDYTAQGVPPDLTAGAYTGVLANGAYLNACGVPSHMAVSVCAAVQNGRAVGVTVRTTPSNPGIESCVRGQVMQKSFPSHPRMDVVTTTFAAN
jgi:hypothetical protein